MFSTKGFIACIPLMHLMQGTYHRYMWLFIAIFTLHGFWMQNHECDLAQSSQASSGSAGIMKSRHSELWKKSRVQHNPVNCGNIYYMHMIANVYIYNKYENNQGISAFLFTYSPLFICFSIYIHLDLYTCRENIIYIYIHKCSVYSMFFC